MFDLIKEIQCSLSNNKLRTALTGFSVAWGIFMLICLMGAGNGLLNALESNNGAYLSNSMTIYPGYSTVASDGLSAYRRMKMEEVDTKWLTDGPYAENIDEISMSTNSKSVTLTLGANTASASLVGKFPVYREIEKLNIVAGRFISPIDIEQRRKMLFISSGQADELAGRKLDDYTQMIGKAVSDGTAMWTIAGVYSTDESDYERSAYAPYSTVKGIYFSKEVEIAEIDATFHGLETLEENDKFEDDYRRVFNVRHRADPEDKNTVYVWNRYSSNIQMSKATRMIRKAIWILGLLTLIGGIVGVSNIMLITVKERTHEFGIRKAIGARPGSILALIVAESVTVTLIFGYVGMFLGMVANKIMDLTVGSKAIDLGIAQITMLVNPSVGLDMALKSTLLLVVAGTFAGLIPAYRAAHIKPIEALRAD